jgi:diguanylate cyclase (GGDEF)-like protein
LWEQVWGATARSSLEIPVFDARALLLPQIGDASALNGARPLAVATMAAWSLVVWLPDGYMLDRDGYELLDVFGRAAMLVVSNARLHAEVQRIALTDELTGVFNRRYLQARLDVELERAARTGDTTGLIIIDLDHFKTVNDRFGHLVGDATLRAVAGELGRILRTYDLIGRFGGEEFVILVPDTSLEGVVQLAERARAMIAALTVPGHDAALSASFGVTAAVAGQPDADTLLRQADEALYRAKANGRNRVEVSRHAE